MHPHPGAHRNETLTQENSNGPGGGSNHDPARSVAYLPGPVPPHRKEVRSCFRNRSAMGVKVWYFFQTR